MENKRLQWLDISKAFGILVVLLVHTERDFGPVTWFGGMFYMPIFFIIAGMTFRYRPSERFLDFLKKKAKRLLVPYFGYNLGLFVFFFLKGCIAAGEITSSSFFPLLGMLYSRNSLYPSGAASNIYFMRILNSPTWFLTCMFVTYILFWLIMRISDGDLKKAVLPAAVSFAFAVLLHYFCPILLPWSIDCALYAVCFMLIGYAAGSSSVIERVYGRPVLLIPAAAVFAVTAYVNGSVNMSVGNYGASMTLYLIIGTLSSVIVMVVSMAVERVKYLSVLSRPAAFLGRHTVPVLCLHLFVYSAAGTLLSLLM